MKTISSTPVELSGHAPEAQAVFVAGCRSASDATRLGRQAGEHWRTALPLSHGRHEFNFIVDGQWCRKPGCEHEYQGISQMRTERIRHDEPRDRRLREG